MVKPKKHLGQHFLTDLSIASRIVEALNVENSPNVLEIGPGKGVLTNILLEIPNLNLKVIEIDRESVTYLHLHHPKLHVISDDFLSIDLTSMFNGSEFKIIGNFPYNISSQILFTMLDNISMVNELVGMFQKEVAQRICSGPGNKDYGILSVLIQANYHAEYLFTVNEDVFYPPPKVKSGVLRLIRKEETLSKEEYHKLRIFVKLAFNQRRKQLRNSIKSVLPENFNHEYLSLRPEQLSYVQFLELMHLM